MGSRNPCGKQESLWKKGTFAGSRNPCGKQGTPALGTPPARPCAAAAPPPGGALAPPLLPGGAVPAG